LVRAAEHHEEDFHRRGRQGGDQHRVRFSNDGKMVATIGATPGQYLPSDITTVINLTIKKSSSDDD
jgi:hypothetical protein